MKIIYTKHFPPLGFTAINILGIIFARTEYKRLTETEINHEKIHTRQIIEMCGPFYYVVYFFEWLIRLYQYKKPLLAYQNISFEREAYRNDKNPKYLNQRKPFSFINYYREKKE